MHYSKHCLEIFEAENTPEASIEYYKKLSERSAREASDATIENKQLKRKIKEMEEEIANLRGTVTISVQIVTKLMKWSTPCFFSNNRIQVGVFFNQSTLGTYRFLH